MMQIPFQLQFASRRSKPLAQAVRKEFALRKKSRIVSRHDGANALEISTIAPWHLLARGIGCGPWPRTIRSRLSRYEIIEKVLPNLTAEHLKGPGYGDAIG
jgi:hypothetical protein